MVLDLKKYYKSRFFNDKWVSSHCNKCEVRGVQQQQQLTSDDIKFLVKLGFRVLEQNKKNAKTSCR